MECSPIVWKTEVPSQVESYQRLKKMILDATLLNTQHYKVRIEGKVEQFKEWSCAFPYTSVLKILKREPSGHSRLRSPTLLIFVLWVECFPIAWNTGVQSQVESYQRLKMVLDMSLLNTQHYKVRIKGKVKQSRVRILTYAPPRCGTYWKGAFWSPTLLLLIYIYCCRWLTYDQNNGLTQREY